MLNDDKYPTSVAAWISIFGVIRGTEYISSSFSVTVYLEFYNKKGALNVEYIRVDGEKIEVGRFQKAKTISPLLFGLSLQR